MRYLILALALGLGLQAEKIEFRELSFKEGLAAAKAEGKPVFIDCFTTWCGPCKWMSANIFTESSVAKYYNENYVCLKIDMEKGEGVDIAKKYGIRAYPTLLYLDADGERLLVSVGANRDPQSYIDNGEQAKDPKRNLPYLSANVEDMFDDEEFMQSYFKTMSAANMLPAGMVDRYFEQFSPDEWFKDVNWEILQGSVDDVNSQTFRSVLANGDMLVEAQGEAGASYMERTAFYGLANMLYRARTEEAKAKYADSKNAIFAIDFPGAEKVTFQLDLLGFRMNENFEEYAVLAEKGAQKYYWDDANQLNEMAWTIYEQVKDPKALKAALYWAERAVELNEAHHIIDTYAHLLHANNESEKALEMELKALEMAQAEGVSTKAYQEFIDELKG